MDKDYNEKVIEMFDIDFESPEWKSAVNSYNNRVLLKYDITSGELVRLRRLLKEGNIGLLDKDNQNLLADFIEYAISNITPEKKKRGRPNDDEINKIELAKYLNDEYNRLHFDERLTIDETLERLSRKTTDIGKSLGKKRVDQLRLDYHNNDAYYKHRLYELYSDFGNDLYKLYMMLIGDEEYVDSISCLDDCKPIKIDGFVEEKKIDEDLHNQAICKLAQQFGISESDVEKRLCWYQNTDHISDDDY